MGRPPMPHQQLVWDVGLEVQSEEAGDPHPGEWAYEDVSWFMQRRGGKTTGLRPMIVHRCGSHRMARAFMTAQNRIMAARRWRDATDDLMTSPLALDVKRKTGVGHEELRWHGTQSTFVPFAPNEESMHGEDPDWVGVDELWAFTHEEAAALIAAYRPGFLTKDAQAWKTSTAGTSRSWWYNAEVRTGRASVEAGKTLGRAYFEWGLPDEIDGRPLEDLSDAELVQACIDWHPSNGYNLRPQAVWSAWDEMGHDRNELLRAYGNRTAEDAATEWQAVAEQTWLGAASPMRIPAEARVAFGVEVDPDRRAASVVAAFRVNGRMVTEVLRHDLGTTWVAPYVVGKWERNKPTGVGIVKAGPSADIADTLRLAGVPLVELTWTDYAAACNRHADELAVKTWTHDAHPELTAAARAAVWQSVGRSRAWAVAPGGAPVTALGAATVAGWAQDHPPAEKPEPSAYVY